MAAKAMSCDRSVLAGTWQAGQLHGQYSFSAGLADNYLELRLHPQLVRPLQVLQNYVSSAISVRPYDDGFGLGVFETLLAHDCRAAPAARLAALVTSLQPAIPGLEVFASRTHTDEASEPATSTPPRS